MTSPAISRRPATTGSAAPGSHTHTNACRGSEVIVHFRVLAHELRQHREPVIDPSGLQQATGALLMEQRNAEDRGGLERDTQRDRQIATLDLAHRHVRHADPVGQLLESPAALTPRQPDTSAEQPSGFNRRRRVCARPLHTRYYIISIIRTTILYFLFSVRRFVTTAGRRLWGRAARPHKPSSPYRRALYSSTSLDDDALSTPIPP